MLSFFLQDVLDEILNLTESVSEGFPTYSCIEMVGKNENASVVLTFLKISPFAFILGEDLEDTY